MKNKTCFQIICFFLPFFLFCVLSCKRIQNIPEHLDHDFQSGTSEGLYRIRDLTMILDESAVKIQKNPNSKNQLSVDYKTILSTKKDLYEKHNKPNISGLEEFLKIRTVKKEGKKVRISSGLENVYIDPAISFLNEYQILNYTVIKPKTHQQKIIKKLLGRVRKFKGFPDTDYYILPHFLGNYLILYKVGPVDKIPYDELPLARRIGDMLAVPLVGYSIEYCQAVKILGINNLKETLKYRPVCKGTRQKNKTEKYIRLWLHKKQVFKYLQKLNFFQRDFFEGQWLHTQTLVKSPHDRKGSMKRPAFPSYKMNSAFHTESHFESQLVKFHPSLGKMDVVEVHNLKQDDEKRVLFIPVKWTDYEIARDSEHLNRSFSERLKKVTETSRPYLEIKFNELIQNEFQYSEKGGKSLKSAVITKDYMSFDIEITAKGAVAYLMKYAFKRYKKNTSYIEKKWFKTDHLLFFPLFKVKRKHYEDQADHTQVDEDHFQRVVRFDPQLKEIKWYFSKSSSQLQWIRNLGHKAVDLLNKALQEAGKDSEHQIKIVLDKTGSDKELGDIRYNIINLVLSEGDENEQFRWGPNTANPITGEMVSATANVWVTHILSEYISTIRKYIRFHVYSPAWKMKPFSEDIVELIYGNIDTQNLQCGNLYSEPLGVTPFFHEKINKICKEVSYFITANQGSEFHPKYSSLKDDKVVSSCAHKLVRVKILQSILKSMLHSLGLRDMVSASVDSENFYKDTKEIKKIFEQTSSEIKTASHPAPPQYSSVTDYMDLEYPILDVPGKLDIAALRFLYFDRLDLKNQCMDSGVLEVPAGADKDPDNPQKSILETLHSKGCKKEDIKEYKICGADKWSLSLSCEENGYGTSPLEVTANSICKIHNDLLISRNRYDGKEIELNNFMMSTILRVYKKWKMYRTEILAGQKRSIEDYSFLNPDHIEQYNQIMKEAVKAPDIKSYYMIRKPIFNYLKRLTFAPSKHCVYKEWSDIDNAFHYKAIALENIEERILHKNLEDLDQEKKLFMNCSSPVVKNWLKGELITEVGFFIKERRYFLRPNEKTDDPDESKAFEEIYSMFNQLFDILQDPEFGEEYYKEWLAYINHGVNLNPYVNDPYFQMERIPSYKTDTEKILDLDSYKSLWDIREKYIKTYREALDGDYFVFKIYKGILQGNYSYSQNVQLTQMHFGYHALSLTELKEFTHSIQKHPELHDSNNPFLAKAHENYEAKTEEEKEGTSFTRFMQIHPAVLYNSENSVFLIPYMDGEKNYMSRIFRRYNEFLKCIKEDENQTCNNIEDKKAFIQFILDAYK